MNKDEIVAYLMKKKTYYERMNRALPGSGYAAELVIVTEVISLIEEQAKVIESMREFVEFVRSAPVSSGICCCGDTLVGHSDPYSCGHTPVDQWDHSVGLWIKSIGELTLSKALPSES